MLVNIVDHVLVRLAQVDELSRMAGQDTGYLFELSPLVDTVSTGYLRDVRLRHDIGIQPATELRLGLADGRCRFRDGERFDRDKAMAWVLYLPRRAGLRKPAVGDGARLRRIVAAVGVARGPAPVLPVIVVLRVGLSLALIGAFTLYFRCLARAC